MLQKTEFGISNMGKEKKKGDNRRKEENDPEQCFSLIQNVMRSHVYVLIVEMGR